MDRLERKTNLFYDDYIKEKLEVVEEIEKRGQDASEIRQMISSLEDEVRKKDYLAADQLIYMIDEEIEKKKIQAGIFDNTGLFFS